MRHVLVVCPTARDREELARSPRVPELRFHFAGEVSTDRPGDFDALGFIDETVARFSGAGIEAVIGTHDYPACIVAGAVAQALGLPGASPAALLRSQHKHASRALQRAVAPEAVPRFALLRAGDARAPLPLPCFVKPVKSVFSAFAQRIDDEAALAAYLAEAAPATRAFGRAFAALWQRYAGGPDEIGDFVCEELLGGEQVTVDGYVAGGEVTIMGVVDSIMYPGTISFARFDYPSALPAAVQARMADLAARVAVGLGLDDTPFDVELFWDPARDALSVIEVNPRMSYQFADLYEKVDGANTYDLQLAIALGERPRFGRRRGAFGVARSYVRRAFRDAQVVRAPGAADVAAVVAGFPDARVRVYAHPGRRLSEQLSDMQSFRYLVLNLGGADAADADARCRAAEALLPFAFEPV